METELQGTEEMGSEGQQLSLQISQIFHDNPI